MEREQWSTGWCDAQTIPDWVLFTRISQTVRWCQIATSGLQFEPSMRTPALAPRCLHDGCDDAVSETGRARENQLRHLDEYSYGTRNDTFPEMFGGRLQLFFPDHTLSDGFAEQETAGFFDVDNTPPWDTWIAFFSHSTLSAYAGKNRYLLYYVPRPLVSVGQMGVDLIAEQCIEWLLESETLLAKRLAPNLTD